MLAGHHLAREARFEGESQAILDLWMDRVLAFAVTRDYAPRRRRLRVM